jgi:hypothetical protein
LNAVPPLQITFSNSGYMTHKHYVMSYSRDRKRARFECVTLRIIWHNCRFQLNRRLSHFRVRFFKVNRRLIRLLQLLRCSRNFFTLRHGEERSKKSQVKVARVHVSRSKESPRSTFYDVSIIRFPDVLSNQLIIDERELISALPPDKG